MKLTTIVLAVAIAMSGSFAFAQAGDGDAGYAGRAGGGYAYGGFSRSYGAVFHTGRYGRHAHWVRRHHY